MSTLKTHNLQSPDAGSVNIIMAPNAGMVVAGLSTYSNQINVGSNIKLGTAGVVTATSLRVGGLDSDIANSSADEAIFGRTDSGDTGITIFTGSGSTGRIFFGDGHGSAADRAGTINYSHITNDMSFGTSGNNERLRITSGGDVLIADTTNSIYDDNSGGGMNLKANGQLVLKKQAVSTADPIMWLNDTGQTTNKFILFAQDGNEKASIGLAGNDLRFARDGYNETLRIDSSGRVGVNQSSFATSDTMFSVSETTGHCEIGIISKNDSAVVINLGDTDSYNQGRIKYDNSDNSLQFRTVGTDRLKIDSAGKIKFAVTNVQIELQTSDGSDNGYLNLSGGGACSQGRGAQVVCYGNEHSSQEGRLLLLAGQSGNANGTIDFYTSGSKKATINDSGCLHIGNVGYGDKNYMLDVEGGIACEGAGGGTGRYGTIYSNFGGDSGGRQCGSYTIHGGQMSMHGTGNRYMHIKFDMPASAMWYMKIEGYEYNGNWTSTVNGATISSDKVHYSLSGGYIYSGQAMFNGKAKAHRGITPVWYLHGADLCVYIDTVSTGTGNRWGFYRFSGGHDGIVGRSSAQPIAIVAYSFSSGTSNPF